MGEIRTGSRKTDGDRKVCIFSVLNVCMAYMYPYIYYIIARVDLHGTNSLIYVCSSIIILLVTMLKQS